MKLICMAHRGETQSFLKHSFKTQLESRPYPLYQDAQKNLLLITDEGLYNSFIACSYVLSKFPEINEVYNMGVSGALRSSLLKGEIFSIRTVYGDGEFHSFTTSIQNSNAVDLISAKERVLTKEKREELDVFAPLVDREAWAIAKVSQLLKKDLFIYKLISDEAHENEEICSRVKSESPLWSEKLYRFYLSLQNHTKSKTQEENVDFFWHFSQSMKHEYRELVKKASLQDLSEDALLKACQFDEIQEMDLHEKKKAKLLLSKMRDQLFPQEKILKEKLTALTNSTLANIQFQFDSNLESEEIKFSGTIKDQKSLDNIIFKLQSFPLTKIHDLFEGKDV